MEKRHITFTGLRVTRDDFIASLISDDVLVRIVVDGEVFNIDVKLMKKVSGYFDFWRIEGYTDAVNPITLFVDYYKTEEAGYPPGGFGHFEIEGMI